MRKVLIFAECHNFKPKITKKTQQTQEINKTSSYLKILRKPGDRTSKILLILKVLKKVEGSSINKTAIMAKISHSICKKQK